MYDSQSVGGYTESDYQNLNTKVHMQNITPFFWFDKEAEEAAQFYVSTFKSVFGAKGGKIGDTSRYSEESSSASGQPKGSVMVIEFYLRGQRFTALNGGTPENFDTRFTGAISFVVSCKTQKEIDMLWDKLSADGGATSQCGWLSDKFGISWQIVPDALAKYMGGRDRAGAARAMAALMSMTKIEIAGLKAAYDDKPQGARKSKK